MQKSDVYVVLTNNTINIVTTDPNVADAAKAKTPGSIVKRFPLTAKFQDGNGIVGEALDGDFDMGGEDGGDGTIGQDDVEFVDGPAPEEDGEQPPEDGEFDDQPMDDEGADENADVICMDTELAVRIFEYIAQNQIEGEELQALADKMADLGNDSDDVLTVEHFDEITGGDDIGDQDFDDQDFDSDDQGFADEDGINNDDEGYSDDEMVDQDQDPEVADALELGEDAFDGDQMDPRDEQLWQQYSSGEISREEFMELLQNGADQEYDMVASDTDPYGDDVSGEFGEFNSDVNGEPEDGMDFRLGEDAAPGQQQQADPTIDAQYMNGYNTGKRGGQAAPQNINTPAGAAYNSGFSDAKAGKPPVAPSKRQNESSRRRVKEGVETFAAFLKKIEEKNPVAPTVAALFKSKKKAADLEKPSNVESKHFDIEQDPKTKAVKITNDWTTGVPKSSNSYS